jgi:membrane-bound lytic murein transglycosylase B
MRRSVPGRTALATATAVVVLAVGGGSLGSLGVSPLADTTDMAASDDVIATQSASAGSSVWSSDVAVFGVDGSSPTDDVLPTPTPVPMPPSVTGSASGRGTPTGAAGGSVRVAGQYTIPARVLQAYIHAARVLSVERPACHLPWQLLAAVGRIESDHAWLGEVDGDGTTRRRITGPALDGGPGLAAIHDTDHGRWDGDRVWDRAVGPMQFIPTTWAVLARDGNDDHVADPSNVDDAALAAATYLCGYGRDLSRPDDLRQAVHGYNHSDAYVAVVLAWMQAYTSGPVVATTPTAAPPSVTGSVGPTTSTVTTGSGSPSRSASGSTSPTGATLDPYPTQTPSGSPSPSASPSVSGCPSPAPTASSTDPSATASVTPTPTPTPTAVPTETASGSTSGEPTASGCPTPSPSNSPSTDGSSSVTPTPTASSLPSPTP